MKRATITTAFDDEATARRVAAAVVPDNTDEMHTQVDGTTVETTIERETTGGLQSTADDYVVNLQVALELADCGGEAATRTDRTTDHTGDVTPDQ